MIIIKLKRPVALLICAALLITTAVSANNADIVLAANTTASKTGKYKYVIKVKRTCTETFPASTKDDYSRPWYSFIPQNTVDLTDGIKYKDPESGKKYYKLKSGLRVYAKSSEVKLFKGGLPYSKNKLSFDGVKTEGNHTVITLNSKWKAPFKLNLTPQNYPNKNRIDYGITSATYKYVDILFCYSNKVSGKLDFKGNKLFKKYKWTKTSSGYKLRLYLKKTGAFYGWNACYNKKGQLVFSFLNPATLYKSNNKFGYSLKNIKIYIDAGHGGVEGGTYSCGTKSEKYYTLLYAKELAAELKKLDASIKLSRTTDKTLSIYKRYDIIQNSGADLGISIHFDGSESNTVNGYFAGYFYPFTYNPAKIISGSVKSKNLLKPTKSNGVGFHYFYLSRTFACPVVLTENGFLTGKSDYKKIKTKSFRKKYCRALAEGIMAYFIKTKCAVKSNKSVAPPKISKAEETSSATSSTASKTKNSSTNTSNQTTTK